MSVRVNSRSTEKSVKKMCGVCQKAGLSEKEYTSHFTKSVPGPKGIVICPTILNNECRFCYQYGHFKSACPALAERDKEQKKSEMQEKRVQSNEPIQKSNVVAVNRGGFSLLDDSDSDSDEKLVSKKRTFNQANKPTKKNTDEWPALCKPASQSVTNDKPSFATVISTVAPMKKVDISRPNICGFSVITNAGSHTERVKNLSGFTVISKSGIMHTPGDNVEYKKPIRRSWVDSDSEDEDEVEDNSAW